MAHDKPPRKSNAGRPPLPEDEKKHYKQPGLSLRPDQIAHLQELAEILKITSRSGVNYGKPSWRTLIALMAEMAPVIIAAIKARSEETERTFYPIPITPELTLTIGPPPEVSEGNPEVAQEEVQEAVAGPLEIPIADLPVDNPPSTEG